MDLIYRLKKIDEYLDSSLKNIKNKDEVVAYNDDFKLSNEVQEILDLISTAEENINKATYQMVEQHYFKRADELYDLGIKLIDIKYEFHRVAFLVERGLIMK